MRHIPPSFDTLVGAFRDLTAASAESAATRARVLERAGRARRRHNLLRRVLMPSAIVLAILLSGAALTAAVARWRAPAPASITNATVEPRPARVASVKRPTRLIPALAPETASAPAPERKDDERLAYERAHNAHFFADAPARALVGWDRYLAAYPQGTFAPEARYNRALCLVRLGKLASAADALRPFAAGRFADYRRHEACLLLRWLAERGAANDPEPACALAN